MTTLPELTYHWDRPTDHIGRVALTGELTFVNASALLTLVLDDLTANPLMRELQVDCANLDFCDSYGLSILIRLRRRTDAAGMDLSLLHRSGALNRLLQRTGTSHYLVGEEEHALQDSEPSG